MTSLTKTWCHMKSLVPDAERALIIDLVLGRMSEDDFLGRLGRSRIEVPSLVTNLLERSVEERDSVAVELWLSVGHRFGFEAAAESALVQLAEATWHERHEDVVDALSKLKSESTIVALQRLANADLAYREFDDAASLRAKAVRAIAGLQTHEAIISLTALTGSPHLSAAQAARDWLARLAARASSKGERDLARRNER